MIIKKRVVEGIHERRCELSNLAEGIWERGYAEGEEKGEARGEVKGQKAVIQWIKDHPNSTPEQAMQAFWAVVTPEKCIQANPVIMEPSGVATSRRKETIKTP